MKRFQAEIQEITIFIKSMGSKSDHFEDRSVKSRNYGCCQKLFTDALKTRKGHEKSIQQLLNGTKTNLR